ncbi:MAG: peptidoglycan editing factor PgeF [Acidobacteriota bacterium]|nr:peptidoglycan editing factor PgeF [Acidobacteriota bacterium]
MKTWIESAEAIGQVDELLASVGLGHGRRKTLGGTWQGGERLERQDSQLAKKRTPGRAARAVKVPGWEKYGWLRHGFSTRSGGVSSVYDPGVSKGSLNLGWTKEDEEQNVTKNRRLFLRAIVEGKYEKLLTIRQFHSDMVRVVEMGDCASEGRLETPTGRALLRGDGLMTDVPGVMLGVQVADCVPVLVVDVKRKAVAAFHAGWRGTLGRIAERGIGRMRLRYGSRPEDLVAAIGPSIGPCCYSVGEEVRFEFESQFAYAPELFTEVYDSDPVRDKYPLLFLTARAPGHSNIGPQIHLDLWEANRRQLLDAGLKAKRITVVGECSACARVGGRPKYFSHRGESGFAGRMMGVVGVAPR